MTHAKAVSDYAVIGAVDDAQTPWFAADKVFASCCIVIEVGILALVSAAFSTSTPTEKIPVMMEVEK